MIEVGIKMTNGDVHVIVIKDYDSFKLMLKRDFIDIFCIKILEEITINKSAISHYSIGKKQLNPECFKFTYKINDTYEAIADMEYVKNNKDWCYVDD